MGVLAVSDAGMYEVTSPRASIHSGWHVIREEMLAEASVSPLPWHELNQ